MKQTENLPPVFAGVLQRFTEWVDQFESSNIVEISYPLYHYTDVSGFDGIIRNEELWLTSIFQLNDPVELRFGMDITVQQIKQQVVGERAVVEFFCARLTEVFEGAIFKAFDVFVGSLTSKGNDLEQWRLYGDDARGMALGFSSEAIAAANPAGAYAFLASVGYGDSRATRMHAAIVQKAISVINENMELVRRDKEGGYNFLRLLSIQLSTPILAENVATKHPSYEHESETRVLVVKDSGDAVGVDTRPRRNGTDQLRFVRLKVPLRTPGSLIHVMIGPDAHPDTERAVHEYLRQFGIDPTGIVQRSTIPYRSMRPMEPLHSCLITATR